MKFSSLQHSLFVSFSAVITTVASLGFYAPAQATVKLPQNLCQMDSKQTCPKPKPSWVKTQQALQAGLVAEVYGDDVNTCVGIGFSVSQTGQAAAQVIENAYEVQLPEEMMALEAEQNLNHIIQACESFFAEEHQPASLMPVTDSDDNLVFLPWAGVEKVWLLTT